MLNKKSRCIKQGPHQKRGNLGNPIAKAGSVLDDRRVRHRNPCGEKGRLKILIKHAVSILVEGKLKYI